MLENISLDFNWIDILMIGIIVRMAYLGMRSKLVIEFFRLLGSFAAIFIILHYYVRFGNLLNEYSTIPEHITRFLGFVLLWVSISIIFIFISKSWDLFLRMKANSQVDKWGGLVFALARSILVCSMTLMLLFCSGNYYLGRSVHKSFTGNGMMDIAPTVYMFIYKNFVSKYFPDEHMNAKIFSLKDLGRKDSKEKSK